MFYIVLRVARELCSSHMPHVNIGLICVIYSEILGETYT